VSPALPALYDPGVAFQNLLEVLRERRPRHHDIGPRFIWNRIQHGRLESGFLVIAAPPAAA